MRASACAPLSLQGCAALSDNVTLMDGGTLGIRLMDAIMNCDVLVVVDAVLGGGEPGTIYRLEGEGLRQSMSFRDSMHQTDLVDTLIYCDLAGHRPEAVAIGMEPADYRTMDTALTPVCAARRPQLAEEVLEELRARSVLGEGGGKGISSPGGLCRPQKKEGIMPSF